MMKQERSEAARAAGEIRAYLKQRSIPRRVTSFKHETHSSVTVTLESPSPWLLGSVKDYCWRYKSGECSRHARKPSSSPVVAYVFIDAIYSDELIEAALRHVMASTPGAGQMSNMERQKAVKLVLMSDNPVSEFWPSSPAAGDLGAGR